MKWWQLLWLLHENDEHLRSVLSVPKWEMYQRWLHDEEQIRLSHDRSILDAIVPEELCVAALGGCRYRFVIDEGNLYGGFPATDADKLTAVEVYLRGGGAMMVDSIDRGEAKMPE